MLSRPGGPAATTVGLQLAGALAVSLLGGALVAVSDGDPVILIGVVFGAAFVALGLMRPALFMFGLLLLRPILDNLGANKFADIPSANPAGLAGLVLIAVLVIVLVSAKQFTPPRPASAFIGLLIVSALAACLGLMSVSNIGLDPINELIRLAALAAIYVLASHMISTPEHLRKLFLVVGLSAIIPTIVGLYELVQGPEAVAGFDIGRINGTFGGPLPFSSFLAVTSLVLISLPKTAIKSWLRWSVLAIVFVALVGTYSREGWILFLVGFTLLQWRRRPQVVIGMLLSCAIVVAAVPNVQKRVLPGDKTASGRVAIDSFDWRVDNWRGLLDAWEEKPLTGWGLKSTRYVNPRAPANGFSYQLAGGGYEAHNLGVRALVEGGPLLLLAYLAVFAAMLGSMLRIARDRGWEQCNYARVVMCLWVALLVIAFATDDPFEETAMMYAVLALTGAVEGAHRHFDSQTRGA